MTGHVRRRGERSWELKFDLGTDPVTGKRITRYHSFKGTKRQAEDELVRLKAASGSPNYVEPSKLTTAEFLDRWQREWVALNLTPKTAERYGQLIRTQIVPRIGAVLLQKLKAAELASLYSKMMTDGRLTRRKGKEAGTGLSPATAAYAHRILHRALGHAMQWGIVTGNPAESVDTPRGRRSEITILSKDQVRAVFQELSGTTLFPIAALGLATGMRRSELLALRWRDVDFDRSNLRVVRALEQTKAGLRFKEVKTKHGQRTISLPASVLSELRSHRKVQLEQRLALGIGKEPDDALVFSRPIAIETSDGPVVEIGPLLPHSISTQWRRAAEKLRLRDVTLHAWRHTHASQLIAAGMDVLFLSRRLGHSSPSITLDIYGHLFGSRDDEAADVFEKAFGSVLTE